MGSGFTGFAHAPERQPCRHETKITPVNCPAVMHSNSQEPVIRVGIGGWTYAPWRGLFYPPGTRQADELAFASRRLSSIEINGTFYRTQTRDSFRKWRAATPDDFVFSVKAPRYAIQKKRLAEAGPAIDKFMQSGIDELGPKLGPVLWQLPGTKRFDEADIAAFLALLPRQIAGRAMLHAIEVRHESFNNPDFVALMRRENVAIVFADSDKYPAITDTTGEFVYARLMRSRPDVVSGYPPAEIATWAARFGQSTEPGARRPCYVYFINGAKERAPAAAMALIDDLKKSSGK